MISEEQAFQRMSPVDQLRAPSPRVPPEEAAANRRRNARDLLSIIPGPGNVIAAEDAIEQGGEAMGALREGRYGRAALHGGLSALSGFGAVTGLPTSRMAGNAAREAKNAVFSGPIGLKVAKETPVEAGYVDGVERVFHITDGDNVVGQIHGGLIAPDKFKIDWMQGVGDSANSFGPAKIRSVMSALREHYPGLREIVGERGVGARKGAPRAYENVAVKLPGAQ